MSIDWVTVFAQLANFLLLVWLLKKFLYRPVLDGIAAREADINHRMQAADTARDHALNAQKEFEQALQAHQLQQDAAVEKALASTRAEREALLGQARRQIQQEQQQWQQFTQREKAAFASRLEQQGVESLLAVSRKIISELADEPLEQAIARQFSKKISRVMPALLESSAGQTQGVVHSSQALDPDARQYIIDALRSAIPDVQLQFLHGDAFEPGISLQLGGARLSWTLDSYLDDLSAQLRDDDHDATVREPFS
ncbi:MAG TPA: hypothetical protein VK104_10275 [Burkholderiaceae bacterium]|nr:hypothetical protein [Burkholderiaceae bacterium]